MRVQGAQGRLNEPDEEEEVHLQGAQGRLNGPDEEVLYMYREPMSG